MSGVLNIMNGRRVQVRWMKQLPACLPSTKVQKYKVQKCKSAKVSGVLEHYERYKSSGLLDEAARLLLARSFQLQRGRGTLEENALNFSIFLSTSSLF